MSKENDKSITAIHDVLYGAVRDLDEIKAALYVGMFDKAARMLDAFLADNGGRMSQLRGSAEIARSLAMQKRNSDIRGERTGAFRALEGGK